MEPKENEKMAGKKRKKLQTQFVMCQRLCRPMPEVKRVMKRLSSTRKFCKDYEWKRRPFIPRKSRKADGVGSQHEEKDSMIVNAGVHTNTRSKEEENLAEKNRVAYFATHNKEGELVAEKSNTNSDTQSKEGEHVAEESGAYSDTQNKEKEPVSVKGEILSHIQSRGGEPATEEVVYADAEMNEEEYASDSNSKFSCSCEIIDTVNKSESERRRRVMELLGQLDRDSSVILKPSQDPREQDVLVPYILESSDAGHSDKAAAACKSHCSNTSQPQKKKKFKTNYNDALKNTLEELITAEPSTVKRRRIHKKRVSNTIPEKMNITGQRKLKRSKASDKELSGHVERKSDVAGPQRIKRCKIMGFYVTEHIEGKPIAAEPQKWEEELESNKNINEDISKNSQEKSSTAGPRKRRRIKAIDKIVPKLTQTPKPQLGSQKRGRKSKAEKARLLLLEQMVQCYCVLQNSSSDSHRHIAHLLSQEIVKAKKGELSSAHSEASHGQGFDVSTKPSETTEARVDDCQLQEDFESQVLEIEATFLMNASAGGGQEIPGMSLLSHTLQCSSENTEVSDRTEESNTNKGLREALEKSSELLPPILTPQYAQFKPYLSLPSCICSDDSLSPDKHNTISKHESPVSQNIPFDNEHTQAKPAHSGLHYTSPVCIKSVSHTSLQNTHTSLPGMMQNLPGSADSHTEPQHSHPSYCMQQETSSSIIPHSTDADLNACFPDHTVTKLHVSIPQDSPPEGHSFVLNHIQADPKVGFEENQEQPEFSSPQHTQLESFSLIPHHTQTEPLRSQSEPCYPVCSSPKKKALKSSQKFMCNYNLRSKGLSNDVSETGRPTEVSNLTSLLKKHCKSEPRVCLRKVECDPSLVVIKNAESQRLSGPIARDMSLPISIPFSMLSLPSEQRNVMEVLEKVVDCQEEKSVKGKLQESSSKSACMEDDSDEKRLISNAQGSTGDESDVSVVSDGGAENSVKETSCEKSQGGIAEENFFNEMFHESSEKGPSVMQEGTDLENSQGETVEGSLLEEKFGEMSQNSDLNQETGVESLGGTFDGNILKETSGKSSHKTEDNEMTQEETDAANSQGGIVDGNFCDKMCIEDCQEVETIEINQEGTDEASANNQGKSDNAEHQKVLQRVENNYEASQVEVCQVLAVSVGNSWEGKSGEQGEMVVVAAVNSEGRAEIEMCQMMAVNGVNSQEATSAKGSQLVVVSGGDNQEGGGQVHGEGINSFIPSLYSDGNSNSDFDNTTLHLHQRSKSAHCNFDAKKSNLDQTSISNDDGGRNSGRATLGQDLCSGIIEQSGTLNVDEERVNLADDKQCPPGNDEPSLYQSECGAAGVLCDTSCITTQCVHYLPTETELLEDLERHLDYTRRDWDGQSSFELPEVTLKDTAVGETSPAQASSEEQGEPRQGCESPAPASAPHCEGHNMHTDHTNLNEEGKDMEAASNGDAANSDGEDVLSLYTDYSLLDADISGEAVPHCEADDLKEFHDTEENYTEHSSVSKNEGMAGDLKGSVLADLSEHSQSGDGLEVGTASDEALCLTDSDTESLQSKSSVIDRIVENEAKCTLEEEMLESDALNNLPSGVKDGQSNEAEGPVDEQEVTASPLLSPREVLLGDSCSRECSVPTSAPNNVTSPHCSKPSQNQKNFIPLQANKPGQRGSRDQEAACDKTINDESHCPSSKSNKKTQPPPAAPTPAIPPPPPHRKRTTFVPRLLLPENMGICFFFINRGFCERQDCHFSHEITLECERYLGLRILFLVTDSRQNEAWTLLRHHLSHHRNSLPLAVSLLLPLAKHLVTLSHDKQPSCIRVPSFLTLPLDVAKVRVLCEERHGKAAFRLLCSCHTRASPEGLKILLNIFVRFCESFSERQMLSPWDKVVFWGYDCYGGDSEAKLKDLLNIEWLRLKMSSGNVSKVLEAYSHLSQALTSPNMFFTHITCQVISYFIDAGKLQDSFRVLGEVRRLRANSSSIFMALIPTKRESIQSLVTELQELGGLVCELCVPMPASSWSLLLSHMMAIHDLSMTLDLLWVQMNFMTPEIDILKCLLEEGIAKGPAMLQPLCSFVCRLPEQVLRPLEGSLSCLLSACTPSSQHIKSQIIQHCKKFGINLRPLFNDSALLIEEQTEHYQCNSSVFLKEKTQH
ncbi:uncharacterized protein LOC123506947 isoform X2 [Portunus trituberculatus]|uniref:uncharacterized protein LOC123506947 isoform X2 n=1 Tax=Portunus trituberculatus TaxID=210409 RepID=UPI001E1CEFBB|nr:uncharacterized protein LOC123506947 isoform X2 [Portunus trituberculatus]